MKKKKKIQQNTCGITVCDSIVMSVKKKQLNLRKLESVIIALTGYISAIMVFLRMFDLKYEHISLFISAVLFSAIYILLSLWGKKALWIITISICAAGTIIWQAIDTIAMGYKFVYNTIYQESYHTEIEYYKFLDHRLEEESVTAFLISAVWLLAVIIYIFTIYHPHPIPPLLIVFPIIEIGMYNGLEVNIFWGMMGISYLLACFAMSTIDMGEYSGGSGGFVRKENLFFPKRQMRLKVTEKCGVFIIILVMISTGLAVGGIKITDYKRSDSINERRIAIRDAVNSFTVENLADSVSTLTSAFGLTLKVESHKLGNIASMKYKDRTDLVVTLDKKFNGAIYLKEYTGSIYRDNEWFTLPDSNYNQPVFNDFKTYGIYPQDFPYRFNKILDANNPDYTLWINSFLKGNRNFVPYGTDNVGGLVYNDDCDVSSKKPNKNEFSYKFSAVDSINIGSQLDSPIRNVLSLDEIEDNEWKDIIISYCDDKGSLSYGNYVSLDTELPSDLKFLYNNPQLILTELIQDEYENFVYDKYLQLPDNPNIDEVREAFTDILNMANPNDTPVDQLQILYALREKVSEMVQYSLFPGKTPKNRDFVNYFLLENHKGYCTHYATSGVILARMAGIPARYATGYVIVGDDFDKSTKNADGSYSITLKDNRSHAWIEVYFSGYGWVPFEFTAGYSDQSIDTTPAETTTEASPDDETETTTAASAERNTDTKRKSSTTTTAIDTVQAITTASETTAKIGISGGFGHSGGAQLPKFVKYVIYSVILAFFVILMVIIRRWLIIYARNKHFTENSEAKCAGYIYAYVEDLLELIKIKRDDMMQYDEFANKTEAQIGNIYFTQGSFKEFMDISLRAVFSEDVPEKSEMAKCRSFAENTAKKIYRKQNFFGKFYMKYLACFL